MNVQRIYSTEEIKKIGPHAWPGGYPLYYLDKSNLVLCYDCAVKTDEYSEPVVTYAINEEDTNLICDDCGKRIPSAWGDDDKEDTSGNDEAFGHDGMMP